MKQYPEKSSHTQSSFSFPTRHVCQMYADIGSLIPALGVARGFPGGDCSNRKSSLEVQKQS